MSPKEPATCEAVTQPVESQREGLERSVPALEISFPAGDSVQIRSRIESVRQALDAIRAA